MVVSAIHDRPLVLSLAAALMVMVPLPSLNVMGAVYGVLAVVGSEPSVV